MMWGWGGGYGTPITWIGPIVTIVFWAAVVFGIVVLIRYLVRRGGGNQREDSALEILRRRYARGEISKEQFEDMRRDLG